MDYIATTRQREGWHRAGDENEVPPVESVEHHLYL